jgi:hypothetical protein
MASSLTAGYVIWLIRGGYLLTSLLVQMPVWRFLDPLPILAHVRTEADGAVDEKDRELDQMFERDSAATPDLHRKSDDPEPAPEAG